MLLYKNKKFSNWPYPIKFAIIFSIIGFFFGVIIDLITIIREGLNIFILVMAGYFILIIFWILIGFLVGLIIGFILQLIKR